MKTFLIVSCLLAAAAAISTENLSKLSEAWKDPIAKCGKQHGVAVMTLQDIYENEERRGVSNSPCLHACLLRSLGILNFSGMDGRKVGEYAESIFADQPEVATKLKQAALHCIADVAKNIQDECAMAYLFAQCFLHSN